MPCWVPWAVRPGLNLVVELANSGILDEYGVEILGTDLEAINKAEDRELFRELHVPDQ